jgi:hypothetical protein
MAHSGVNGFGTSVRPPAREITQVKVRKPTVRDLKALETVKGAAARTAKMIELLTGLNAQEVAAIHAEDMKGLGEITALLFRGLEEVRSVLGMLMNRYRWSLTEVERLTADDILEYQAAFQEAQTVSALLIEDPISPGQFPFLEADLGVTELPGANRKVETVREAAAVVIGASDIWHAAGAQIRSRRLAAKSAISAAATDTEAYAAFISAWS